MPECMGNVGKPHPQPREPRSRSRGPGLPPHRGRTFRHNGDSGRSGHAPCHSPPIVGHRSPSIGRRPPPAGDLLAAGVLRQRQANLDVGPPAGRAVDDKPAAVPFDDRLRQRQANPDPAALAVPTVAKDCSMRGCSVPVLLSATSISSSVPSAASDARSPRRPPSRRRSTARPGRAAATPVCHRAARPSAKPRPTRIRRITFSAQSVVNSAARAIASSSVTGMGRMLTNAAMPWS